MDFDRGQPISEGRAHGIVFRLRYWIAKLFCYGFLVLLVRDRSWQEEAFEAIAARAGDRILDFGPGSSSTAISLALRYPKATFVAADPGSKAAEKARRSVAQKKLTNISVIDITLDGRLPFDAGFFDKAVCMLGLHDSPPGDKLRIVKEIARVVRHGGTLHVADFDTPENPREGRPLICQAHFRAAAVAPTQAVIEFDRNRTNIGRESTKAVSLKSHSLCCAAAVSISTTQSSDRLSSAGAPGTKPRLHYRPFQSRCLTEKLLLPSLRQDAALAIQFINKYLSSMSFNAVRRLLVMLLALSLTLGPAMNAVHASSMGTKMAIISLGDMHHEGSCKDCPGSKAGLAPGECTACCIGVPGVSPSVVAIEVLPAETQRYLTPKSLTDHRIPPDPHPPRPTVLG